MEGLTIEGGALQADEEVDKTNDGGLAQAVAAAGLIVGGAFVLYLLAGSLVALIKSNWGGRGRKGNGEDSEDGFELHFDFVWGFGRSERSN